MQKQTSKHINELVLELTQLCFDINTKTNYCCRLDMAGHIDAISVHVARNNSDYEYSIYRTGFLYYSDEEISVSEMEQQLTNAITELSKYMIAPAHISEHLMDYHNQLQQSVNR